MLGSGFREEKDGGKRYNLYVVPHTWPVLTVLILGLALVMAFIATYRSDSISDVMTRLALLTAWWGTLALLGLESNWVQLNRDGMNWSRVAIVTPGGPVSGGSGAKYADIDDIQPKGSEQAEIRYVERGRRDKKRKMTLRMRPQARDDFVTEMSARIEADKRRGDIGG